MTGMLRDAKHLTHISGGGCGGACCNTKAQLRKVKKALKQEEKDNWKKEAEDEVLDR